MPQEWTGDLIGLMHNHKIKKIQLAEELGVTPEYVSMILNGHRTPDGSEERFRSAVGAIIMRERGKYD